MCLFYRGKIHGGWGFHQGGASDIYMTAVASAALQQFPQVTSIATAVNKASAYLVNHQNEDGGFGASGSTAYETAVAYSALVAVSSSSPALSAAINYLTVTQSSDGSWQEDPYSTALALKALHYSENKPAAPPAPPAGGVIVGTVVDAVTNVRVSGVAVVLADNSLNATTTDSAGNFTLADVPSGSHLLNFSRTGYASVSATANVVVNAVTDLGNVSMASSYSTGTIAGSITDATGKPLGGVTVSVTGAWTGNAVTGTDGSYVFSFVTPGTVTVTVAKPGLTAMTGSGTVYARTTLYFSPRLSNSPPPVTTGTIVGRVIGSSYWEGPILPLDGEPGVRITLSNGTYTEPDANGYFIIQGISPNTYQTTVGKDGYATKIFRLVITPGSTIDLGTIRLESTVSEMTLTGKVTDALTGAPIPGAELIVSDGNLTGRSDFAGVYAIADIKHPSTFTLRVSAAGYVGKSFTIGSSAWLETMDFALVPLNMKGSMTGFVVDADSGVPVPGAVITLLDSASSAVSDSAGAFNLSSVSEGVQRFTVAAAGYVTRTVTTPIVAGAANNLGKIPLSVNQLGASIQGTVSDAVAGAAFAGASIQTSGAAVLQTTTANDGGYRLDNVAPGAITVEAAAPTKLGYYPARFSAILDPGGVLVFNPTLTTLKPGAVELSVQTDKESYRKEERVGFSVVLKNSESISRSTQLRVRMIDPSGATIFEDGASTELAGDGVTALDFTAPLPANVQGGQYTICAELFDSTGVNLGLVSKNIAVATSRIAVTPILPAAFAVGQNEVSFDLANAGELPVGSGALEITLKDPDGTAIATKTLSFALGLGERTTLKFALTIPPLKFGTYRLSYRQSDETVEGLAKEIPLPNSIAIAALYDSNSHRVRNSAGLTLLITNTGRFTMAGEGSTIPVSVAIPDAAFAETKMLAPAPAVGAAVGSALAFSFTIPETMTAAQHPTRITVTLPSGSTSVENATLAIPESSLAIAPLAAGYKAGEVIHATITNDGGVDTTAQCRFSLYDARSVTVAEQLTSTTLWAGASQPLDLTVPAGATDGSYRLEMNCKDLKNGKDLLVEHPASVTGVKASINVTTDKDNYLLAEAVTALAGITNSGTDFSGGNLHLKVTTGSGVQQTKTWTTQADFQTGIRSSVDTFGVNDWIIPDDDFSAASINRNRWAATGNVSVQNGRAVVNSTAVPSQLLSLWQLSGDFDIEVKFDSSVSVNDQGPRLAVSCGSWSAAVQNTVASGWKGELLFGTQQLRNSTGAYANSGRLRIVRSGSLALLYYWNGTTWSELLRGSNESVTQPVQVALSAWSSGSGTGPSAAFDDFKVNSGRIKTENQTVDSVRLLPLDDNFDDGVLNTDRWRVSAGDVPVESSGSLHLKSSAAAPSSSVELRPTLAGDFSATLDYKNFLATPTGIPNAQLYLFASISGTPSAFYVVRGSGEPSRVGGQYIVGLSIINGNYFIGLNQPFTSNFGKLRLARYVTTGNDDYFDGTSWNTCFSDPGLPTAPAVVSISAGSGVDKPSLDVDLNNFYTNKGTYAASGKLFLKHDSGISANHWGKLLYSAQTPQGTSITIRTRTAETEAGLSSAIWSSYATASGAPVTSPAARWIQIEVNLATASTEVTPVLQDLTVTYATNPGETVWEADLPVNLSVSQVKELTGAIGSLHRIGKFTLSGTLSSSTGQLVASAEYPFYVEQGNVQGTLATDRKTYRPGETVTFTGKVSNLSGIATSGLAIVVKGAGGETLFQDNYSLAANSTRTFSFTMTAGAPGNYNYSGNVTQGGVVLSDLAGTFEVAGPEMNADLLVPEKVGDAPFVVSLSLFNTGKVAAVATVRFSDDSGGAIDEQAVSVPAGESRVLQYQRQTAVSTTYTASLTGDLTATIAKKAQYVPAVAGNAVGGTIVADRVRYYPNTAVVLISTVSASAARENLTTVVSVTNGKGQGLYTAVQSIPVLNAGQTLSGKSYWNTGSAPAGTYKISLQVLDAGSVIATAGCDLVIETPTKPSVLLRAALSIDRQSVLSGQAVNLSYDVANIGNVDLADVPIAVRVVDLAEQKIYDTISGQISLTVGASAAGSGRVDTLNYGAKDYLVILSATIGGVEETLAGSYFRVEGAPSTPALSSPPVGSDVETLTPVLAVSNAADPNNDRLSYAFEVYSDRAMTTLVASATVPEMTGTTSWTVPEPLVENVTYFWRARAYDGRLYGIWMDIASFRVNTANDPPSAPTVSGPVDGGNVAVLTPTLAVTNASDPDSADLTYNFDLSLDPQFTQIVASVKGIPAGDGTTSWDIPVSLSENTTYYWRAQADDWFIEGPWSATAAFFVNTANDAPSAPAVAAPGNGATVATLDTDIVIQNSIDPDSAALSYYFEADTRATFDSPDLIRSGAVAEGTGGTTWHVSGLKDNSRYFVRVKASDGAAESAWSAVSQFAVNTVNDAPTTPVLANPSDGSGVAVFSPALSVHNATDLDGDRLSYQFAVYADAAMTQFVTGADAVAETPEVTSWQIPQLLTENTTYYWHARAFDGVSYSAWMPAAAFTVNTANDAPSAPKPYLPADNSSVETTTPVLQVVNASDPDSGALSYDFEIYSGTSLVASGTGVPGSSSGVTGWAPTVALADNSVYLWRARAFDGESYGPWTALASFTVHVPTTSINAAINFDPNTLNRQSGGTWVVVYIELPSGYRASDIDISSVRLEGSVPAEVRPYSIGDYDKDGRSDLMVKFRRNDAISLLPVGDKVPVHVSGKVGGVTFEGVDVIRVIK
ncbi:carboxypeptidase regulatory-like domain-containing protein [Geomonas anaerohicana]|uniref:Carboxypeptidase regulatory-like domain-containing protein n=1 Tax=Geomonas anaerohicana TaxID=2798583 RepID=A0ABS0YJ78_9BACT|nr:carboxypeptidase regulatory-like domain-containing protein [Geomonas anaerohicana]MBJ6752397.1 carboxypeptidase regulatory-like domain-containing protein [Geomonas anaerohicana]